MSHPTYLAIIILIYYRLFYERLFRVYIHEDANIGLHYEYLILSTLVQ